VDLSCRQKRGSRKKHRPLPAGVRLRRGTRKLYDFITTIAGHELPVDYINDGAECHDRQLISINNAVEVDLFGQVSSESSGTSRSAHRGQLDFVMGAYLSKGGRASSAYLPPTARRRRKNPYRPISRPAASDRQPQLVQWVVTSSQGNLKA